MLYYTHSLFWRILMSTRIVITNDTKPDNISIFYLDPLFLVTFSREDFNNLKSIDESQKPGIYILLSDNKRYVGQASNSIFSRLEQHNTNKNWWKKVVFFGRDDCHLSKSQLDYMEKSLINTLSKLDILLDNSTMGNISYINRVDKIQSDKLLNLKDMIIRKYTNIDLYAKNINNNNLSRKKDTKSLNKTKCIKLLTNKFINSSNRGVFIDVITYLIKNGYLEKLSAFVAADAKPTYTHFIGTKPIISNSGTMLTKRINGTSYCIYVNYSKQSFIRTFNKISNALHTNIDINI